MVGDEIQQRVARTEIGMALVIDQEETIADFVPDAEEATSRAAMPHGVGEHSEILEPVAEISVNSVHYLPVAIQS